MSQRFSHVRLLAVSFQALICFLALGCGLLFGQGVSYITGVVQDETAASIPGSRVLITNQATGTAVSTSTNAAGVFRSPALLPGPYEVTVTAQGFQTLVRRGIVVELGQATSLNLTMPVGEVTEQIEVTAELPLLRTEDPGLGQNVQFENVKRLPYLNRSAGVLLQLTPNVRYGGEDPISYGASRFNAQGVGNFNVMVNGAPVGGNRTDVNQMTFNPSVEALDEVRVVTNQYSAEFGQDVGPLVMMNTRSGSNEFHGGAYYYFRNEKLDTYNVFSRTRPLDRQNIFGGMVGGPIVKNKLFFFTNWEVQKQSNPAGDRLTFATAAMKAGDFSAVTNSAGVPVTIYDPGTSRTVGDQFIRDPFPNNTIPGDRIDAVARNVVAFWPNPTLPGFAANLPVSTGNDNTKYRSVNRVDWNIGDNDRFMFTHMSDDTDLRFRGYDAINSIEPAASPNQHAFVFLTQVFNFEETHMFSPSLFMTNRVVWRPRYITRDLPAFNPEAQWGHTLGLSGFAGERLPQDLGGDMGFPSFNFSGFTPTGPGFMLFQEKPINEFSVYHTMNYIKGRHSFKFGFQTERGLHGAPDQSHPTGLYNFGPVETSLPGVANTGNSIASFLLGQTDSATTTLGPRQIWYNWYYSFFLQDDWKVSSNLTINLGLRWDIDAPVYEQENLGNGMDLTRVNPVSGTLGVVTFKGRNGEPAGFYDTDWSRFAPRIGFAYRVGEKVVVRGGYGLYNTSPVLGANRRAPNLGVVTTANFSSPDGGRTPAFKLDQGFPSYPLGGDLDTLGEGFGAVPFGSSPTTSPTFVDPSWNFGYSQNFNLSIQTELPGNMLFEIAGQGVLGRNLSTSWAWNQVPPELRGLTGSAQGRRPFPQYNNVTEVKAQSGSTDFAGLTLRAEKRFSNGFSFITNYAFSKTIGTIGVEDSYNPGLSRGPTIYEEGNNPRGQVYHSGLFSWVYELPFGPGKSRASSGAAAKILGGWDIGGVFTWLGGVPFGLSSGQDSLNCFCGLGGRANVVGDLTGIEQTPDRWFNTSAVVAPAFGTVGTAGPGILLSPSNANLNLAIGKNTRIIGEKVNLRLVAEGFNLTNSPQWGVPTSNLSSPNFGRITATTVDFPGVGNISAGARIMQLALRIEF